MKNGEHACDYFRILNPIEHARTKENALKYKVEPYVVAADVYSNIHMLGRGGWTWYTGSSSWLYVAGIESILGIKKCGNFLMINPCITKDWESYFVSYCNENAKYEIHVYNPDANNFGVKRAYLDNEELEVNAEKGVCIFLEEEGEHKVDIIL